MGPRESLPGFLFNVQKWRGSRSAQRMSFSQRGVYLEMMFEQWDKRFLADDAQAVAEAIANTPEQVAEVLAAWPVVRPKFVTADRGPRRIYNAALERTRRDQRANLQKKRDAGKIGGKASAAKRKQTQQKESNDRSTTVQRPSTEKLDLNREGRSDQRDLITRPWSGPVIGRNPHLACAACGPNLQWCVPSAVNTKLAERLAPKHGGDRDAAKEALQVWYPTVWAKLPPDYVMRGDAFKWWEGQFDAAFVSEASPSVANKRVTGLVAGGERFLRGGQ